MINRDAALQLIENNLKSSNLKKHSLSVECVMRRLAERWKDENPDEWAMAGLLHDLDYDFTQNDPGRHGLLSVEMLRDEDLPPVVLEGIKSHAGHGERVSRLAKALYAADPLTGLIVAAALMHPNKSLSATDTEFVLKRFREKHFARGARREQIMECAGLGLSLEEFVDDALTAMCGISKELGL